MTAPSPRGNGLTPTELRLVEQYVSVLDYLSRCAQAVDHGDWYYLADKADALAVQAERLASLTGEIQQAIRQGRRRPRAVAVAEAVAHEGRHYRAGRLLHPGPEGRR
jgi:hypothetical protein